jgi:hypothetical protein
VTDGPTLTDGATVTNVDALRATLAALPRDANGYATRGADPGGGPRAMLGQFLYDYANGRCVVCGEATRRGVNAREWDRAEAGHILPAGPKRSGYTPGNLGNMCRACNSAAGDTDLTPYLTRFVYPEGIPTSWPAFNKPTTDYTAQQARHAIRKRNGLPF